MRKTIVCAHCKNLSSKLDSVTASSQVSLTNPTGAWEKVWFGQYTCWRCKSKSSRVSPLRNSLSGEMFDRATAFNNDETFYLPTSGRELGFVVRNDSSSAGQTFSTTYGPTVNYVARNRRRKTAGAKDIKSKTETTSDHGVTEIDLELT